ncbi:MAG: hypothetical protein HQL10_13950 [Nitrospirae bacterium]|nr:hypothetical protein [Nitrospirota bacterium]
MSKRILAALLIVLCLTGVAFAADGGTAQVDARFAAANEWLNKNNLSVTSAPEQAFVNDYVLVFAEGLPLPTAKSPAQRRLTATRAATVMAYRQLTEFLEGVAIVGDTLVKDAELQYDVVRAAVAGVVKGAQIVHQEFNDQEGSAIVFVKIGMTGPQGFGRTMYEKMLGDPKIKKAVVEPEPVPQFKQKPVPLDNKYDGLVIDATDQNFRPALINRIFTTKGEVIYDPSKISQKVLVEQGCGEYTNSVDKAKAALESRGVKNPLIVKASGTVSASDLQVSDDDAVKIYSANQKGTFLAGAKVAFVLK